jgi:hypothetical protein
MKEHTIMTRKIQTTAPAGGSRDLLPDGEYILTIEETKIEEDQYAKPDKDGELPEKLVVTWLLESQDITPRQKKKGVKEGKKLWSRYGLFCYVKADGAPTALKALLDALEGSENMHGVQFAYSKAEPDIDEIAEDLVGCKARCMVEVYTKKMGARAGEQDNRIMKVLPLEEEEEEEVPAPPRKNVPQRIRSAPPVEEQGEVDEDGIF